MIDLNKYICIRPWTHIEIHCIGNELVIYPCCPSWIKSSYGNIKDISDLNIINTSNAKKFRETVLNGEYNKCKTEICPYIQEYNPVITKDRKDIKVEDLRFGDVTLLKISKGKIAKSFTDLEKIKKELGV